MQVMLKSTALLCLGLAALVSAAGVCPAADPAGNVPEFPAVTAAMKEFVARENIAGAVTVVARSASAFSTHSRVRGFIQYAAFLDNLTQEEVVPRQALAHLGGRANQKVHAEPHVGLT